MKNERVTRTKEEQPPPESVSYKDPGMMLIVIYFLLIIMTLVVGKVVTTQLGPQSSPSGEKQMNISQFSGTTSAGALATPLPSPRLGAGNFAGLNC